MFVLDTSALIAGLKFPPEEVLIPMSVLNELKLKSSEISLYRVVEADKKIVEKVKEASKKTGDYDVLSQTDFEVLALGYQENATIVTDDYAIQNVASYLKIKFISAGISEIKEQRKWKWRCTGCGRYYRKYYKECPVCGSPLRRVKDK